MAATPTRYYNTGKRKAAVARVWLLAGSGAMRVNTQPLAAYFPLDTHQGMIQEPFALTETVGQCRGCHTRG